MTYAKEPREKRSERNEARTSSFKARTGDRQPMGGYTLQLAATGIPEGYVGRWFIDDGERIQQALNAGYVPMLKDGSIGDIEVSGGDLAHEGQWHQKFTGQTEFGKETSYLMAIRKEWFDESQAAKQVDIDLFDEAIQQGKQFDARGNMVTDPTTYSKASIQHNADALKR